jgi:hypothetical protein
MDADNKDVLIFLLALALAILIFWKPVVEILKQIFGKGDSL